MLTYIVDLCHPLSTQRIYLSDLSSLFLSACMRSNRSQESERDISVLLQIAIAAIEQRP